MIYTFGDGFAAGHIWPEWPQLVEVLTHNTVENYGHIGAGNEYIFNCAVKQALLSNKDDIFLVQWADPVRFDKLVEDDKWAELQQKDDVYRNINSKVFGQNWWCTSGSTLPEIKEYKNLYIQRTQAINRSVCYMVALSKMLDSYGIKHGYFLTYPFDYSVHGNYADLTNLPWVDTVDMDTWTTNTGVRGNEIQPSTVSQCMWVVDKLTAFLSIEPTHASKVLSLIQESNIIPYDPDRDKFWQDFKNKL